jgi:NADH-quinone oxidoreductase subunit I
MIRILQQIGYALLSVGKGMGVTLINLFRPKQTIQYPSQELLLPPTYRGALHFDEDKCIVCELCEKACPVPGSRTEWTIEMFHHIGENKKRQLDEFFIDYSTCINCYLCVEACPTDALVPGSSFEHSRIDPLASYDRSRLIFGKEMLHRMPRSDEAGSFERAYDHVKAGSMPDPKPLPEAEQAAGPRTPAAEEALKAGRQDNSQG